MDSYNVVELFHYFKILFLKIAPTHSSSDNSATLIVPPSDAFIAFMQSKSLFFHFQNPITSSYNIKAHLDRQRNSVGYNHTTQTNYGIPILNGNANDERKKILGDEFSTFFRPAFFSILFICWLQLAKSMFSRYYTVPSKPSWRYRLHPVVCLNQPLIVQWFCFS